MNFLASIFGLAPAAAPISTQHQSPPAIFATAETISVAIQSGGSDRAAITTDTLAAHPACAVLDLMAGTFRAGLVTHGSDRAAMADALMALRWAEIRTPEFVGPGKRRASAKAARRFRAVLDSVIVNGSGAAADRGVPDVCSF